MWLKIFFIYIRIYMIASIRGNNIKFKESVHDYKVYRVQTKNEQQCEALGLLENKLKLDTWIKLNEYSDIMVSPLVQSDFEEELRRKNFTYKILIENLERLLVAQKPETIPSNNFNWNSFHSLDEINNWIDQQAARYPTVIKPFIIGLSYEGRPIKGIKLSFKEGNKAVFIESSIHANDWITSSVATYFIDHLLASRIPAIRDVAENVDWYIIPVLNPDGFVYSHEYDSTWRKSRMPSGLNTSTTEENCIGTDLNRNFDIRWMEFGSSKDPCTSNFAGAFPESDPEVKQLVEFVKKLPENETALYLSLHSFVYNRNLLSPWGYTKLLPSNYKQMMTTAIGFSDAAERRYGTKYYYGSSADISYKVSGDSKDWAYDVKHIPITFSIILPNVSRPPMPPEQIIPICRETVDGFVGMILAAREVGVLPKPRTIF